MKLGARLQAAVESDYLGLAVVALIMLIAPLGFTNHYDYDVAMKIGLNGIVAVGLNLLIGYAGQISLGHAGFFALGAYASAILPSRYHVPGGLALLLGALGAGLLAWAVARPMLRLRGHYLAMGTLGFGIIISIVLNREIDYTGGPDGVAVPTLVVFGRRLHAPETWYWIIAVALLLVVWLSVHLMRSAFGRGLRALADSETAAQTAGLDTAAMKASVFVLSAVIAALAGSLFANAQRFVTPEEAGFGRSIEFVTMVVVGGMASTYGAVVGAALITLLPQALSGFEQWHDLLFGVILVAVMIFLPRGLVPSITQRIAERRRARAVLPIPAPVGTAAPPDAIPDASSAVMARGAAADSGKLS